MKKHIKILSASDRFNYGDLLFPIIAQKELSGLDVKVTNVAIKKTDLSHIGALPTEAYSELFRSEQGEQTIVLVAGGDVFSVNWSAVYSYLNFWYNKLYWRISNKVLLEKLTYRLLGYSPTKNPFIPIFDGKRNSTKLIFHSVGGKPLTDSVTSDAINNALYFSVRDKSVQQYFSDQSNINTPLLTPDSAILMSKYYSFAPSEEQYIAIQLGHYTAELPEIVFQLNKLAETTGYNIKLIPIGNCIGHDDLYSLTYLKQNMSVEVDIIQPTIENIMRTIANARFFAGTSLHGIITAMSFAVPYAGLNPRVLKLTNYLSTWAPPEFKDMIEFGDICETAVCRMHINIEVLRSNSLEQKELSSNSFEQVIKIVTSY